MAYWWVSQNRTFKQERAGGFLWAPLEDKAGRAPFHWATMGRVQPGDVIFSYFRGRIAAVSVAKSAAFPFEKPAEDHFDPWRSDGLRVDAAYEDPQRTVTVASIVDQLQPLLPSRNSPLTSAGQGNQGYLYELPTQAGRFLLDATGAGGIDPSDAPIVRGLGDSVPDKTTRTALVESRVGQGKFRSDLLELWQSRCCVTRLEVAELLRASHIKPWRDCDNRQRLDPYNGLLLSPAYDAAFDAHLISFDDAGRLLLSSALPADQAAKIGIAASARIDGLTDEHRVYLADHRRETLNTGQ